MDEGAVDTFSFAMPLSGMLQVSQTTDTAEYFAFRI